MIVFCCSGATLTVSNINKIISPCENPNSWWTGTVFRFDILWVTENMLCETKIMWNTKHVIYANTYHISKNDLTFHEWNLDFGTLRNLTLHFGTSRNLTFHEWNLHFGTSRNLTFHEWNLHFGTSRNLTFHEWNLHFGTSRNLTFHEWNLHFGTGSIPSEPLGTWCKVSGGCPKPPRSFIGRTPSLSGCWGIRYVTNQWRYSSGRKNKSARGFA